MHADNNTSNRVEGFFGSLKNLTDHQILSLPLIFRAVYLRGERLRILSASDKRIEMPDDIILREDALKIGSVALSIVLNEYNEMNRVGCITEYNSECCNICIMFGIPCKHFVLERIKEDRMPLLLLDDFLPRWRHSDNLNINLIDNSVVTVQKNKTNDSDWSYSNCVAKFERYFSSASKNQKNQDILHAILDNLFSIEHQSGINEEILLPPNF